jgi:sulfatase maturation enzyme AslB (radical SAM superfamily)
MLDAELPQPGDSPRRIVIELTNICNLHCSYCLRDDEALYQTRARFFSIDLLRRILRDAKPPESAVSFTGEPTLITFQRDPRGGWREGMRASFVTNGWHFDRVWPVLDVHRSAVSLVSFSVDGATPERDRWRGEGSFDDRAFTRCRMGRIPFAVKAVIRRDTVPQFQDIVLLAARMGAQAIHFSHVLPTSGEVESESAMSLEERAHAEQEIALLRGILKMPVALDVGYANTDPAPPCAPLQGSSFSVDYQGRLTLCCNMSGFRGAAQESDDRRSERGEFHHRLAACASAGGRAGRTASGGAGRAGSGRRSLHDLTMPFMSQSSERFRWHSLTTVGIEN